MANRALLLALDSTDPPSEHDGCYPSRVPWGASPELHLVVQQDGSWADRHRGPGNCRIHVGSPSAMGVSRPRPVLTNDPSEIFLEGRPVAR